MYISSIGPKQFLLFSSRLLGRDTWGLRLYTFSCDLASEFFVNMSPTNADTYKPKDPGILVLLCPRGNKQHHCFTVCGFKHSLKLAATSPLKIVQAPQKGKFIFQQAIAFQSSKASWLLDSGKVHATPLKTNMAMENLHFLIGDTSSNDCFANVMLVFGGVTRCN